MTERTPSPGRAAPRHRPLSDWVADVSVDRQGIVRRYSAETINSGDERADARALPRFITGWRRAEIPLSTDGAVMGVLGLVESQTGETVIELDEFGDPIPLTAEGADVLDRIEEEWPQVSRTAPVLAALAHEEPTVCHLLLERLALEGDPPPELFHLLPWPQVDALVRSLLADRPSSPKVRLRHWFTPLGSRFSVALEQIDEGLRSQDVQLARRGATSLCARLLATEVARIPPNTRENLALLAERLGGLDPLLGYAAELAAYLLRQGSVADEIGPWLRSELPAIAGTASARERTDELRWGPFMVFSTVTGTGALLVNIEIELGPELAAARTAAYGVILMRLAVAPADRDASTYLVPLLRVSFGLQGRLGLHVPGGKFRLTTPGPPLGLSEVAALAGPELARSVAAADGPWLQAWRTLASMLPADHPLTGVLAERDGTSS
jgi:hypothetical protein